MCNVASKRGMRRQCPTWSMEDVVHFQSMGVKECTSIVDFNRKLAIFYTSSGCSHDFFETVISCMYGDVIN